MPVIPVDPADPRLEPYRTISDRELLRARGLFVAEGRAVVERVVAGGRCSIESALLNDAAIAALRPLFESFAPQVPIYRSDAAGFQQITGFNIHRGCLALVRRPSPQPWREIASAASLVVVLEAVTDADNVGSVFRNAAAFEAQAVLLSPGCCDPLYRKAIRTSMGAVLAVPFARLEQWPADIAALRDAGFLVVALSPQEPSIALDDFALSRAAAGPVALMLGTEGAGLSAGAEAQAAVRVRIPIASMVDSLNVAAASAVALHAIRAGASRSTRD